MRPQELRALSTQELKVELEGSLREFMNLRFGWATRQLANVREIRKARRKVARIKTLLRERELAPGQEGAA